MRKSQLKLGVSLACLVVASTNLASAQQQMALADESNAPPNSNFVALDSSAGGIEEVVVTAQRRNESVQDVPMTVQAFTGERLREQNITTLEDLIKYTPNIAFANNGPGQGNIYMRGLSTGFAGNQSSATVGSFPNVAIYLDDQSMQFPSRNVDIYMIDMERVEVLEGPQGTLFGGGAEAGALRYITNKPKLNQYEANAEGAYSFTAGGDPNTSLNATINLPLVKDRLALRVSIYDERQGGYLNNVPSTFTRSNNDLGIASYWNIRPNTSGICPNGKPAGTAGYCNLANTPIANNASVAGTAENPTTYTGGRAAIKAQLTDDWDLLVTESLSNLDAQGLDAMFPVGSEFQTLKPLQVTFFSPTYDHDRWHSTAWTLNGQIGDIQAVYTGSYMSRHIEQQMDYTNYTRTASGIYYECTGAGTGWGNGTPVCYSPVGYWHDTVNSDHWTEELRASTPSSWRVRGIAGAFWEDFLIEDVMNFNYKTIPSCSSGNLASALAGGPACVANVGTYAGSTANNPGVRGDNTAFGEDTRRGYSQTALFASADFDIIPQVLTVTGGTRFYRYDEFEKGSQYETDQPNCLDVPNGQCVLPAGGNFSIDAEHDKKHYQGFRSRGNITWKVRPDLLTYFTFSQGFRPGAFNRSPRSVFKDANGNPQFTSPNGYAPDRLTNYEIGVKSDLFDKKLQLNLSGYYMQWNNVQQFLYLPAFNLNTTVGLNGPDYDIKGLEAQLIAKPVAGLTLQSALSYNDNTQSNSPCLTDNRANTASFGQCITTALPKGSSSVVPFTNPFGVIGGQSAFSPRLQGSAHARYEWKFLDYKAFAGLGGNYTGGMYNQPANYPSGNGVLVPSTTYLRYYQPSYYTLDANLGVMKDFWQISLFGTNLNNSHASMFTSSAQFIKSEVPLRPMVVGMKIGASF